MKTDLQQKIDAFVRLFSLEMNYWEKSNMLSDLEDHIYVLSVLVFVMKALIILSSSNLFPFSFPANRRKKNRSISNESRNDSIMG